MLRTITVANTKTQKRERFECDVTTLGELKKELDVRGIDYDGMSFTEGLSKTILKEDASILPSNLPYKGQTTNNLVILLTNTEKKISSGADRKALYAAVKENNLQDAIAKKFKKNYTNVTTADLEKFVNDNVKKGAAQKPAEKPAENKETKPEAQPETKPEAKKEETISALDLVVKGINGLKNEGILSDEDIAKLAVILSGGENCQKSAENADVLDSDIEDMIRDAKKHK